MPGIMPAAQPLPKELVLCVGVGRLLVELEEKETWMTESFLFYITTWGGVHEVKLGFSSRSMTETVEIVL